MSKYTWVITQDDVPGDVSSAFAKIGPSGVTDRMSLGKVIQGGEHFRLLTSAGEVKYTGYIHGDYSGPEPLDDYGRSNECVDIEYDVGGPLGGSRRHHSREDLTLIAHPVERNDKAPSLRGLVICTPGSVVRAQSIN